MRKNITDIVTTFYMHGWIFKGLEIKKTEWNDIELSVGDAAGLIHIAVKILDFDKIIFKTNWDKDVMMTDNENLPFALEDLNERIKIIMVKKKEAIKKLERLKQDFED
jgi:hypothetical protein